MYKIIGADGKEYGPVSIDQLKQWITEGRINLQSKVLAEGGTEWKTAADVPELVAAMPAAALPPVGGYAAATPEIPNYLWQSIAVTLCCCLPCGIAAIVFAAQVKTKATAGDIAGAQESSRKAKMWCWISFGLGLVANLIVLIIQILAITASAGRGM